MIPGKLSKSSRRMSWWQENTRPMRFQDRRWVLLHPKSCCLGQTLLFVLLCFAFLKWLISGWYDGDRHKRAALCEPWEDRQGQVRLHHRQLRCLWDLLHIEGARQHARGQVIQIWQSGFILMSFLCNRHEIFLATKHGVEAKNYEGLGDAAKLKPLEVNFCLWRVFSKFCTQWSI